MHEFIMPCLENSFCLTNLLRGKPILPIQIIKPEFGLRRLSSFAATAHYNQQT